MIIRTWRGRAPVSNPGRYIEHFRRSVIPELRGIDGFVGASLLRQDEPDGVTFFVLTRWASMDAICAFAGADPTKAVVESEAVAALLDFDPTVTHYELVEDFSRGAA